MWRIDNPFLKSAVLDFSSSGQQKLSVLQLIADDIVLMNAVELIDWEHDRTQILICDSCGTPGCNSGGWIAPRRTIDRIFLVPAFGVMEQDAWSRTEYSPPTYFRKIGVPYFDLKRYEQLLGNRYGFPTVNDIPELTLGEALRLAQLEMPFQMFSDPPEHFLAREKGALVVAASAGEAGEHLESIKEVLNHGYASSEPVHVRKPQPDEEIVYYS